MPKRLARFAGVLSLALLAAGTGALSQSRPAGAADSAVSPPPKLVVLIMVDQMRADYIEHFQGDWSGGLKRLVTQGAWFRRAAYPYLTTVTCAGHSTVATGAFPRTTGIIGNAWFDRGSDALVTCNTDPDAKDIGYGGASRGGDSAARLQVRTFADEMRGQRGARVVSLSLKDRSAIMMAGRGGDAVTWLSNAFDGWVTSTAFTSAPVPAVKAFTDANPLDADYGKTWTPTLAPSRYLGPDDGEAEAPPAGWTRTFPHELKSPTGKPDAEYYAQWERSPFADAYLGRFAAALAESLRLGAGGHTDVLAVSFSSPDLLGHAFGPRSQEVQDMYANLDRTIGALLDRLDALVGRNGYVVGLTADHGVTPLPEQLKRDGLDAGRVNTATLSAIIETQAKSLAGDGRYVRQWNVNDVYFQPGMYAKLRQSAGGLGAVLAALSAAPGVARAFSSEDLQAPAAAASTDPLLRAAALSYFPGRSGDIIIAPKPGWMVSASGTTHGSASEDDQRVPVVLFGPGIKPGTYDQAITPADLAPTLAAISGISMPSAEGRVLREALAPAVGR